jgi:kumamolisin
MLRTTFRFSCNLAVLSLFLAVALQATAQTKLTAIDRGPLDAREAATSMSVTIALALRNLANAEELQEALYTPGDPRYHQFLTADEFVVRFAPSGADIAKVTAALEKYGLTVEKATATTLRATGLPSAMERTFQVTLHDFEISAEDGLVGSRFHAPLGRPIIPAEISSAVSAVVGLDNSPSLRPHYKTSSPVTLTLPETAPVSASGDPFDAFLTVADFATYYDVNPLYDQGLTGAGRTLGILTFAAFTPSDAFAYWAAIGLKVNPNRITIVNIDGGPGAPSDASGSIETTLDVEQSGGVAPGTNIIVYQAPNTLANFVDVFAAAVDQNIADTFSTSWGTWEIFYNSEFTPVTFDGATVGASQAIHQLLLRASIQGQTPFASAGDGGAYDVNDDLGCIGPYSPSTVGSCSLTLSQDYPASDPLITAAGGTTLAGLQEYCLTKACTGSALLKINVPHERVWGWDYLEPLCLALGLSPFSTACGIFPAGTGGGVSIAFPLPSYQTGIIGTQLSQPDQVLLFNGGTGAANQLVIPLPAFFPGRNIPDISFNADPQTGYVIYYTSSKPGVGFEKIQAGGTSFVAPQLNGVSSLYVQDVKTRIGLLNNSMYPLVRNGLGYFGPNPAFHAILFGDNWFYFGTNGYNPGVGIGTLDVANFAQTLHSIFLSNATIE